VFNQHHIRTFAIHDTRLSHSIITSLPSLHTSHLHSHLTLNTVITHYSLHIYIFTQLKPKIWLRMGGNLSNSTITQMSHPYMTRSLFDRVDDVDASSSVGPNSSPDIVLPIYSDLPDDIPFLQLEVDSI
jgi:hypothetical protein